MELLQWVKGVRKLYISSVEDVVGYHSIEEKVIVLHVDLEEVKDGEVTIGLRKRRVVIECAV